MEPLNLMVSLSHFAGHKSEKKRYLSDGPGRANSGPGRRRARTEERRHHWWRKAWLGVTNMATR
jgi:hypothetical protein